MKFGLGKDRSKIVTVLPKAELLRKIRVILYFWFHIRTFYDKMILSFGKCSVVCVK